VSDIDFTSGAPEFDFTDPTDKTATTDKPKSTNAKPLSVRERLDAAMSAATNPGKVLNHSALRQAAEEIVEAEVIKDRLHGDPRGYKRWSTQNASFKNYLIQTRIGELSGASGNVVRTDEQIAERAAKVKATLYGKNGVRTPSGLIVTRQMWLNLGNKLPGADSEGSK
jgi:transcriptional regulator of nitric oxide reductase